ncbi:alpha 1,2-mannosyltransferase 2.4.1 [Gryganskiella cystojenkinii]|nr:alpha 1,2-mannosyltransferase 2.4.1 [Gryganskiella cystojenkinii]
MIIYTIWATYYHHATKDRPHNIPIVSALKDFVDLPDVSHDGVQSNPIPVIAGSQHHHHHHHHKQTLSKGQLSQHQQQQQKPILLPYPPPPKIPIRKANAAFVMLVREQDLQGARQAVREIEDRFNRNFEYPYVFLNEISFSNNFQRTMRTISKANMTFGLIPKEHWSYPSWISEDLARKARYKMRNIVYGWSESYRHMCRYQSGFFFQHETMLQYDFYWRIEPDVEYTCDIDFDPFLYMQDNNKKYGNVKSDHFGCR